MEIVAPAGDYSRFDACLKAGAGSIYLGLKGIGARRKAPNFSLDELKSAIDQAHLRGVKVFLTLNTIYKDSEIESLYENMKTLYNWGIDAFIVQDLGMIKFIRDNFPNIEIHGSTQMTVSNHIEANYLKSIGLSRVVLARELSFDEIKSIKEKSKIELEIFVSGALCVSYSGNCYMSSFVGSRSGNRGLCAQPCRKAYKCSDKEGFFLSPKDQLMEEKEIEALKDIGIESIKVEGRMKSEEYVYETVSYYRDILDGLYRKNESYKFFNRGYSKGYFYGADSKLINDNFSFDLGYLLGIIKGKEITLEDDLKLGDGLVFLNKNLVKISGEYVNKILDLQGEQLREAKKGQRIVMKVPEGTYFVHKTYDKNTYENVQKILKEKKRRLGIDIELTIKTSEKIRVIFRSKKNIVELYGQTLEMAKKSIDREKIAEKISELGETTFYAENVKIDYDDKAFISFSYLKELKREAINLLEAKIINSYRRETKEKKFLNREYINTRKIPKIMYSVLNDLQYKYLKSKGIEEVYYKNNDVLKENSLDKVDNQKKLVGNLGQLLISKKDGIWLDWNANIINSYAFSVLNEIKNLEGVFISPEIKAEEIEKIDTFGLKKGLVIYGKMRVMYIEKDLVETETEIINEENDSFILRKNDLSNTEVYLNEELNLIPKIDDLEKMGFDYLKVELTFETENEIDGIIEAIKQKKGKYKPYNFERGLY